MTKIYQLVYEFCINQNHNPVSIMIVLKTYKNINFGRYILFIINVINYCLLKI